MHSKHLVHSGKHTERAVAAARRTAGTPGPFESLGSVFEDLLGDPIMREPAGYTPPVDIRETERTIEVSVGLSGVEKKDIALDLTEDSLAISCERRGEKNEKNAGGYRLKEQSYNRFYRALSLPSAVKTGDAKAAFKDGILRITLQKQRTDTHRQIHVK